MSDNKTWNCRNQERNSCLVGPAGAPPPGGSGARLRCGRSGCASRRPCTVYLGSTNLQQNIAFLFSSFMSGELESCVHGEGKGSQATLDDVPSFVR